MEKLFDIINISLTNAHHTRSIVNNGSILLLIYSCAVFLLFCVEERGTTTQQS